MSSTPVSSTPVLHGLRLREDAADGLAAVHDDLRALHPDPDGAGERLAQAAARTGFTLVTADADAGLVGYAAASRAGETIRLDPVVLAPALNTMDADRVCRSLVEAALRSDERPWAHVTVPPTSPAVGVLLRDGWRPVKTPPEATYLLFSGADARA